QTCALFYSIHRRHPRSPLFPYTTLFRSLDQRQLEPAPTGQALARAEHAIDDVAMCGVRRQPPGGDVWMGEQAVHRAQRTGAAGRSEEHTSELQSRGHLVCRLLLEKKQIR